MIHDQGHGQYTAGVLRLIRNEGGSGLTALYGFTAQSWMSLRSIRFKLFPFAFFYVTARVHKGTINPFTAPAYKISGLKSAHTHTPANSIFSSPVTNLLSVLCVLVEILSRTNAEIKEKA